jgi:hypothetical protein
MKKTNAEGKGIEKDIKQNDKQMNNKYICYMKRMMGNNSANIDKTNDHPSS